MNFATITLSLLLTLLLTSCQGGSSEVPRAPLAPPPPLESLGRATVTVDDSTVVRASIPSELFGVNVEWIEQGNGMADATGVFPSAWSDVARNAGVDHVRWPGGTFSDYYHWIDGTGPLANRPRVSHHTDPTVEADAVGTAGIARFAQSFAGKLLLTVNAGSGTAAEAADWVRYANAATDARRAADGFAQALAVGDWEIGNEVYLPNNPGTPSVAKTAAQYTAIVNAFAPAMRAAVPDRPIRILAVAEASSSWYPMSNPSWLNTLLAGAAANIDLVAVHQSYHPILYNDTEASRSTREVYQALWAAPEAVSDSLDRLTATLDAAERAHSLPTGKLGIAITEWGTLFGSDKRWIDHGKTLGSALYVARMFQIYAAHDRVRLADAFKMSDSAAQGWVGFDRTAKPVWEVLSLMARQKGNSVLGVRVTGASTYQTGRVGSVEARSAVPELAAQATQATDGKTLWVTAVNRSWDQSYEVSLVLPAGFASATATEHLLSGASVTDHNGPDVRPWIPSSYYIDPPRSGPVAHTTTGVGTRRTFSVPAHAFLAVELRRP